MKIEIPQSKLKEGLNIIGRAAAKSVNLPILKNILIKTDNNFVNLIATDLEIGIKWWALSKNKEEGELTIPLSSFSSFINLLPDKKIELEKSGDSVLIYCEDYKTQINGMSSQDFPIIPQIKKEGSIFIESSFLCKGINQIIDIPSLSKVKPEISGVLFSFSGKELKIVATDSYRLAEKKIYLKESVDSPFDFIIPQKSAKELVNIFKDINKNIEILFDENQIIFRVNMDDFNHPYIELVSKVIDGNYPNYENIIPQDLKTEVILNKDELVNKIKAASFFTSKVNEVNLFFSSENREIVIKSSNSDLGNYEAKIKGEFKGGDVNISFNYRFLIDGLMNIDSSEVSFKVNEDSSPGLLKPVGRDDYLYVVMPIKN